MEDVCFEKEFVGKPESIYQEETKSSHCDPVTAIVAKKLFVACLFALQVSGMLLNWIFLCLDMYSDHLYL